MVHETNSERSTGRCMTDGRWVLVEDTVVDGADAATFARVVTTALGGLSRREWSEYNIDKHRVYRRARALDGVDPGSFRVVEILDGQRLPAPLRDVGSLVLVDRAHVWRSNGDELIEIELTRGQFLALRAAVDLAADQARVAH
jgi:hypothetical protein